LRDIPDAGASSSACAVDGRPKKRDTPHSMAASPRGQWRWQGMGWHLLCCRQVKKADQILESLYSDELWNLSILVN
jgi:hypothetical protein